MQKRIEQICDQIIEERRWRPFGDREVAITKGGSPVVASIGLRDRRIRLTFSDRFETLVREMIQKHALSINVDTAVEAIVHHLLVHEYNHHHYCPGSTHLFEEILDGIRNVVEKREVREARIKQVCFEIHNMFSDTIIDTIESRSEQSGRYCAGRDLSLLLALSHAHRGVFGGRTDKAMQLFLESNRYLCGSSQELTEKFKPYLPLLVRNESVAVKDILGVLLEEPSLVDRTLTGFLLEHDNREIVRHMCDYPSWHIKAECYAQIIHPYLKRQHEWLKNNFTGKDGGNGQSGADSGKADGRGEDGLPEPGEPPETSEPTCRSGDPSGQSGIERPSEDVTDKIDQEAPRLRGSPPGQNDDQPADGSQDAGATPPVDTQLVPPGGSEKFDAAASVTQEDFRYVFEQDNARNSPSNSKLITVEPRDQDSGKPVGGTVLGLLKGRLAGFGSKRFSPHKIDYEGLDRLYQERAGQIKLSDDDGGVNSVEVLISTENADHSDLSRVRLSSSIVIRPPDGATHLWLKERAFPLSIDASVEENIGGLPDLCFVFDSSGSMGFDPQHSKGEYDIAVLTFYSILRSLDAKGIAPLLKYNSINFSNVTFASGWQSYRDLEKVKRVLFQYQGGGTTIDVNRLSELRNSRSDNYLLFILSDLMITNIDALECEFIDTHQSRAASVLVFKLGGRNLLCERLEDSGMSVLYPSKAEDFMYGSIKIAREAFSL
ncbi:MAG: VWA domain-containing protein [Acidobacteria bacterium]|nr:VWA domain-containing protein [Acidobacteriota bacterium]